MPAAQRAAHGQELGIQKHIGLILAVLAAALLLAGCSASPTAPPIEAASSGAAAAPPTMQATPLSTPSEAATAPTAEPPPAPPVRDLLELTQRLRGIDVSPTVAPRPEPVAGDRARFWLTDLRTYQHYETDATLVLVTDEAAYWVEDGVAIAPQEIETAAAGFEQRVLPTIRRYFGDFASPGVDGDPRLHILHARLSGVAGYFSVADQYPTAINPYSNEREMIYLNVEVVRPGTEPYFATLAHELQHAVHWNQHRSEDAWVNEGAAELGAKLTGLPASFQVSFARQPNTQLNTWPDDIGRSAPHYGAAFLFLSFLFHNYGGYDAIPQLLQQPSDGLDGIDEYLAAMGFTANAETVFQSWTIANLLGRTTPPYAYDPPTIRVQPEPSLMQQSTVQGQVEQFAARYFRLPPTTSEQRITFLGSPTVPLIATTPPNGRYFWWSNQGDSIDSRLTRAVDLTGVDRATLRFSLWYDIEEHWDYAYVLASTDGGTTWHVLPGKHTTDADPHGHSFGPAYTGKSGGGLTPVWMSEEIDLSPYAGERILLRFEYVTDEGTNNQGFVIDDLSIPEIGWADDAESAGDWEAEGFHRTDNLLAQRYFVQVVDAADPPVVHELAIGPDGRGELVLPPAPDGVERVLIVAAATRHSRVPAAFEVTVR